MGLIAADLDGAAGTEVFVAVDQRPNHLLVPADAGKSGGIPRLRRAGRTAGLATAGSDPYACMGVACGDADGDGRADLFVTNYADQPNTLYRNASGPGGPLFEDGTAAAGLYDPGFPTLGFGAQFLDADRDGDPDLAYLNGHLDDFTHAGAAFRMKPAFFLNGGGGRFAEAPAEIAGPFFGRPDLGRALARLDADGDGRDDLAAAHLGGPARLLRNVFAAGAGVGLRVADPAGDRDAVGATVTVTAPTAGGGAPAGPRSHVRDGGRRVRREQRAGAELRPGGDAGRGTELIASSAVARRPGGGLRGRGGRRAVPADAGAGGRRRRAVSRGRLAGRRRGADDGGVTPSRPRPLAAFLTAGAAALAAGCDRGTDPAPAAPAGPATAAATGTAAEFPAGPFFKDATDAAGLSFVRFDGRTPGPGGTIEGGRRMYEWTGGGVAAFDLDADGRPDLALTQGREWGPRNDPPSSDPDPAAPYRDALFRNAGGRFEDVTGPAGFLSTGFGQGAAAGDWDGDGFADLYICNIGGNRLLRNEGDGTFTDVTEHAGLGEDGGTGRAAAWTMSAALADLNADGLPDLYDANYAEGEDVFVRVCPAGGGRTRVCGPWTFAAAADRLLFNNGDGTFADASDDAGLPTGPGAAGPAIGALAADLDGAAGTEVFVAVDQRPNHLLVRDPAAPGRLTQAGWAAGVATAGPAGLDEYACMGVACGDADADGRADLFVTNYADQPNTLYRNASGPGGMFFEDATAAAGLYDPGFPTLGFGAQFLDADRDGDPDLAYLNGHLDDFTADGVPFRMRPAFFLNGGGGRFAEAPAEIAGPFFGRPDLGRALARLDADGDGRDDLAAAHLGGPARLLRNVFAGGSRRGPAGDVTRPGTGTPSGRR